MIAIKIFFVNKISLFFFIKIRYCASLKIFLNIILLKFIILFCIDSVSAYAPYHVNVNALGPSLIITPGTVHIQQDPELAKKYKAMIPLGRLGVPKDVIGACVFLASEASDFITGQTIFIDGGLTAG